MFPQGFSSIVRFVQVLIAIEVHGLDPPEGSLWRVPGPTASSHPILAFAGWLELFALLQALVDSEADQAAD